MSYEPQRFTAPDGTPLIVITEADYQRLIARPTEDTLIARLDADLAEHRESGGGVPGEVMAMLLDRVAPVAAWRRYRGMTQAELAEATGMSQSAISALEAQGRRMPHAANRRKLAEAFKTTLAAFDACWN